MTLTITLADTPARIALVREFLLHSHSVLNSLHNWDPRRWDGLLFHRDTDAMTQERRRVAQEVAMVHRGGTLVGVAIPEYPGGVHVQVIPDDAPVQEALISWAEQHLRQSKPEGGSWLEVHCLDYDLIRKQILRGHGFAPLPEFESIRSRRMVERVPQLPLPAGFKFASAGRRDGERMAMLLNAAFARTTHSAEEWVNFCAYAPSFRSDLQVVVIAPDDSFAAHAGLTVHTDQGFATIEPVCTHPVYQNRGLAKAAISEALRRTQNLGVSTVYVSAWHSNPVSNHVYDAMGFGEPRNLRIWRREFED